jgi:NAD-reducing hydrogenase small subunit
MANKPKVATCSLAGCFGCHMSVLDIDDRILKLIELIEFDRSPINDIKKIEGRCAVGIIEGGCCNEENVHVLKHFREHCDVLISTGDCATMGGIPALRNTIPLKECLDEAYLKGPTVYNPSGKLPSDPEIPLLGGHHLGGIDGVARRQASGLAVRAHQVRLSHRRTREEGIPP